MKELIPLTLKLRSREEMDDKYVEFNSMLSRWKESNSARNYEINMNEDLFEIEIKTYLENE